MAEPPSEVGQEPQRRRVGPVRVVDEQRERPVAGEVRRQPVQPVQDGERSLRPERQGGGLGEWDVEQRRRVARRALEGRRGDRRRGPRARAAAARPRTRTRARARPREPRAASAQLRARFRAPRRPVRSYRSPPDPPRRPRAPHPPPRLRRPLGSRQAPRSAPGGRPARRAPSCSSGGIQQSGRLYSGPRWQGGESAAPHGASMCRCVGHRRRGRAPLDRTRLAGVMVPVSGRRSGDRPGDINVSEARKAPRRAARFRNPARGTRGMYSACPSSEKQCRVAGASHAGGGTRTPT